MNFNITILTCCKVSLSPDNAIFSIFLPSDLTIVLITMVKIFSTAVDDVRENIRFQDTQSPERGIAILIKVAIPSCLMKQARELVENANKEGLTICE